MSWNRSIQKLFRLFAGVGFCIFLDQWCKIWVRSFLKIPGKSYVIQPFLSLVHTWNYGISFGLFPCRSEAERFVLLGISLFLSFTIFLWFCKTTSMRQQMGYTFILGGALSNIWDRFAHHAVFDFICFHWKNLAFPAFNVADMLITMGFLVLMSEYLKWQS